MKTMPTRIDGLLFEAAKIAGDQQSRSAAQQLDHWARIGRELELSPAVTHESISRVLAGLAPYDELPDREQAVVRAEWDERIAERIGGLNFAEKMTRPWPEVDGAGKPIILTNE